MSPRLTFLLFALACAAPAVAGERPRGVVELFTSQGCSSCPAADRLLGELARDRSLIVVSMPVDYWDYMGWKDTLASPLCTARQKGYAAARGDGQVYTPQAVVDGLTHALGADRDALLAAIAADRAAKGALTVDVSAEVAGGRARIEVGAGPHENAIVWLLDIERSATVQIGRGENAGRTLTYSNVMRHIARLGDWTGDPARFDAPPPPPGHAYVALLQAGSPARPGPILGAAQTK